MTQAKDGDTVKVHYTGTLNDGTVFDTSVERDPLEFTIGEGRLIPGFENAIVGLEEGDSKQINIAAADAYGEYREELVADIERKQLPDDIEPQVGMVLQAKTESGELTNVMIKGVEGDAVTLDGNHPLAGQELNFDLKLVEVS